MVAVPQKEIAHLEPQMLVIDEITVHEDLYQFRVNGLNEARVEAYIADMNAREPLPPVEVCEVEGEMILTQGFHRLEAAKRRGQIHIQAIVHEGLTAQQALERAATGNLRHGLSNTPDDKKNIMLRMMMPGYSWESLSYRQIAQQLKCSPSTISKWHAEFVDNGKLPDRGDKVQTADGRVMDISGQRDVSYKNDLPLTMLHSLRYIGRGEHRQFDEHHYSELARRGLIQLRPGLPPKITEAGKQELAKHEFDLTKLPPQVASSTQSAHSAVEDVLAKARLARKLDLLVRQKLITPQSAENERWEEVTPDMQDTRLKRVRTGEVLGGPQPRPADQMQQIINTMNEPDRAEEQRLRDEKEAEQRLALMLAVQLQNRALELGQWGSLDFFNRLNLQVLDNTAINTRISLEKSAIRALELWLESLAHSTAIDMNSQQQERLERLFELHKRMQTIAMNAKPTAPQEPSASDKTDSQEAKRTDPRVWLYGEKTKPLFEVGDIAWTWLQPGMDKPGDVLCKVKIVNRWWAVKLEWGYRIDYISPELGFRALDESDLLAQEPDNDVPEDDPVEVTPEWVLGQLDDDDKQALSLINSRGVGSLGQNEFLASRKKLIYLGACEAVQNNGWHEAKVTKLGKAVLVALNAESAAVAKAWQELSSVDSEAPKAIDDNAMPEWLNYNHVQWLLKAKILSTLELKAFEETGAAGVLLNKGLFAKMNQSVSLTERGEMALAAFAKAQPDALVCEAVDGLTWKMLDSLLADVHYYSIGAAAAVSAGFLRRTEQGIKRTDEGNKAWIALNKWAGGNDE